MSKDNFSTITLLFPGQGAQYVGMYKSLSDNGVPASIYQQIFSTLDSTLNRPFTELALNGPSNELNLTENTQPIILSHSYSQLTYLKEILSKKSKKIDLVLGHSVGEYAALLASEVYSFKDAIEMVHFRGKFMQESVLQENTGMYAILKVPMDIIEEGCKRVSDYKNNSIVVAANYNEPLQTVVSGHTKACENLMEWIRNHFNDNFKSVKLAVSAPFHSPLMKDAALKMAEIIKSKTFNNLKIPYIANIDAKLYQPNTPIQKIKENLIEQIPGTVHWVKSVQSLPENTLCIEVGPSKILQGLLKRIRPELKVIALDQVNSFNLIEELI